MSMMYIADTQVQPPTHWVVEENETKEVDPELTGLGRACGKSVPIERDGNGPVVTGLLSIPS